MKFLKWFALILLSLCVMIFAAFKFFPGEMFLLRSYLPDFSAKSFITSSNDIPTEETTFDELMENGAIVNDSLMLVNDEHPFPENYYPEITGYNGVSINPLAEKGYVDLKNDVKKKFGKNLYIMSAFRTPDEQKEIIESGNEYAANVYSSEHLTGLALDVYIKYYAGAGFIDSEEGQYVNEFCHNYGFIIRYPHYGEEITGIPYEPWHIRYVGLPHSKVIMDNNLTLEEYIESFVPGVVYYYYHYFITRQDPEKSFSVPKNSYNIEISPDNTGFYIVTGKYK